MVRTCWLTDEFYAELRHDGWFGWLSEKQESQFDDPFSSRWRNALFGIQHRRFIRNLIEYLGQLQREFSSGEYALGEWPKPMEFESTPGWNLTQPYNMVCEWFAMVDGAGVSLRLRQTVLLLRILEYSGSLALQREQASALALPGTRIRFEGDDCIVSLDLSAPGKLHVGYQGESYRLKPLN